MSCSPYPADKVACLSHDDLLEEYRQMERTFRSLQKQMESGKQQIYELNRNLQSGKATQDYLSSELESLQCSREAELRSVGQKYSVEIEKLKAEIGNLQSDRACLEKQLEEMRESLDSQEKNFQRQLAEKEAEKSLNVSRNEPSFDANAYQLVEKVNELEEQVFTLTNTRQELTQEREKLLDKVGALQETAQIRLEELEEKSQVIEELQAKLFEVNSELIGLKNEEPDAMNRKGNSLFGEVDDQRQKMKSILAAQSKKYNEMKTAHRESQREIKRLKQENAGIMDELSCIKRMFERADMTYKNELLAYTGDLKRTIEALNEKIVWTEEKLIRTTKEQGVNWLDEMLKYSDNQVSKVKTNFERVCLQKIQLEDSHHKMQQDLAKWRYKCLKYKCALINRDLLLEERGVKVPDVQDVPVNSDVQVDIDNLEDTFERQITLKPLLEVSVAEEEPCEKENSSEAANKIQYRDMNWPVGALKAPMDARRNERRASSPVAVYLGSKSDTSSKGDPPGTEILAPEARKCKAPSFTVRKIVFRK